MKNLLNLIDENTFIISDHHFGHKNIEKYEPIRKKKADELGYQNSEQMLIDLWNRTVGKNDIVLYLGDFSFKGNTPEHYLEKLNGIKIFIFGNHDPIRSSKSYHSVYGLYIEFNDELLIHSSEDKYHSGIIKTIKGKKVMFCHYPLEYNDSWDNKKEHLKNRIAKLKKFYDEFGCDIVVHGHVHSNSKEVDYHINVSCEDLDFIPKRIGDIL